MVNQILEPGATESELPTLIPASRLQEGQAVLYEGMPLQVRRVVPAFTRPNACHVHLVPLGWQRLEGVSPELADRDESTILVRVACPTRRVFQVVA